MALLPNPRRMVSPLQAAATPPPPPSAVNFAAAPVAARAAPPPITQFTAQDNLRSAQINPVASARLGGVQQGVSRAYQGVMNAPDLRQAATERMALLEEQSQPGYEQAVRGIGQRAAALGRTGAGMTTSELGDAFVLRQRALADARRQIGSELAKDEFGQRMQQLGAGAGLESQLYGQEAGQRGELRGEREYQGGMAREAMDRRIQQRMLEDALLTSGMGRAATGAGVQLQGAEQLGRQAESQFGTASDLLSQLAMEDYLRRRGGGYGGTRPYSGTPTTPNERG